ncbi:alpha/beta hydrolase domain-containing protein [Skermania piniformis]|uniref:Alpha/beta hydrolase domain-containing protein n=1 Tax=Skermania pinensis TaxID=39122 RepID=A0ABX8S8L3_9ACTN|nr:alpha/beta hydrolase domain-containing protein [Skermania piniformis]QXQ14213.1 hypothetical protein KV203_01890 [Skermania piniformis]
MAVAVTLLTGGNGPLLASATTGPDLAAAGYLEREYLVEGVAGNYRMVGPQSPDGRVEYEKGSETSPFATRAIVRRPAEAARSNGTLVVEWLNVSGGQDAGPGYTYLAAELVRGGYTWVGVSAQYAGVMGGAAAVPLSDGEPAESRGGPAAFDPVRYQRLHHPGDAYSYDIFSSVARGLRDPAGPLGDLPITRVVATGESQSAVALCSYHNGIQPLTDLFDAFLIHSRGGAVAPLGEPGRALTIDEVLDGPPTRLRDDLTVPTVVVQTETDLFGRLAYLPARQADSTWLRVWEIAGTAHADKFQIGEFEPILGCPRPVNRGQQVFVLRAALRALDRWVSDGTAAPSAPCLDIATGDGEPEFARDEWGNVTGGVRTPAVDVPTTTLSGLPAPDASLICSLFGSTEPIAAQRLRARYGSADAYLRQYAAATDAMIAAGFALVEDRDELLGQAEPAALDG